MKFAIAGGERIEAKPGLSASCPCCQSPVIAKCGRLRVWHWSHKGKLSCDPWHEPETEWHRAWKNRFPVDWQEVVLTAQGGERHRADVRTAAGQVIEFQHSRLHPDARASREAFYGRLIWIVDGRARKRDVANFFKSLRSPLRHFQLLPTFAVLSDECALLRDWSPCKVPVYFDFGDTDDGQQPTVWRLHPGAHGCFAYLTQVPREQYVQLLLAGTDFDDGWSHAVNVFIEGAQQVNRQSSPLPGFQRFQAVRQRARRRL